MFSNRKLIDCRWFRDQQPCDIVISGNEEDVLDVAVLHAVHAHGCRNTTAFREELRAMLCDEDKAQKAA
jgi:hypothetical protein